MNILITGANGMLGSSLCKLYHSKHKVFAIHRDNQVYSPCFKDFKLDLLDKKKIFKIFNKIKPDIVIHCAGLTNIEICEKEPDLAYETNVKITENISEVCSKNIKLVYISTDQIYGDCDNKNEKNIKNYPLNMYGKTKLLGETKVSNICQDYLIVRTNIFGWNIKSKRKSSAEWIYDSLKSKRKLTLFKDYLFSPIFTDYFGNIIMDLFDKNNIKIINVAGKGQCSKYEFGIQIAKEFNLDDSYISIGSINDHKFFANRNKNISLNCDLLSKLNINYPTWKDSIKAFANMKI